MPAAGASGALVVVMERAMGAEEGSGGCGLTKRRAGTLERWVERREEGLIW